MLQAKLASDAVELRRQLYASLPFTVRLAHFWLKLSFSDAQLLGSVAYATFLGWGVQGMPDIKGQPALEYAAAKGIKGPRDIPKLPRGYGQEFGKIAIGTGRKKLPADLKNSGAMDDITATVIEKLLKGSYSKGGAPVGGPLKSAQAFIVKMVNNEVLDLIRKWKHRRGPALQDEEGKTLDFSSPDEFLEVARELTPAEIDRMFKEIAQLGKDSRGADFIRMRLKGYSQTEIAKELGVSVPAVSQWLKKNKSQIKDIIQRYLA
jgi:RNA polymerase sigma factor (sigma-70 family)